MDNETDPDYTLRLNQVPRCCGDNLSLLPKTNLAVYTCEHLLCLDCFSEKADLCRMNDGGKFAFFLTDHKELVEAADALRAVMAEFTKSQRSREGQQVSRLILKLQHLIQGRLAAKPEHIKLASKPDEQASPPIQVKAEEVKKPGQSAPSSDSALLANQGSEGKQPGAVQNPASVVDKSVPTVLAVDPNLPAAPKSAPTGTSSQTVVKSNEEAKNLQGESRQDNGGCKCCGKKCSLL